MATKISRICDGVIEAASLAVVIVTPLFFNVNSSRIFEPDKIALVRTLALVMLASWAVKLVEINSSNWNKHETKRTFLKNIIQTPMVKPVLGLVAVYIISNIFSVSPRVSFFGSYQRLQGTYTTISYLIIFAVILGNIRKRGQIERILTTIILTSLPVSIYGILQKFQLDPIPWGGDTTTRIASSMGNSIFIAAYLIMVVILIIGRIIYLITTIKHNPISLKILLLFVLYVFILMIDLIAIILSGSRGPFLGLFVGVVFLILMLTTAWRVRWITLLLMVGALIAGVFLVMLNISNGPLESLRDTAWIGRFSQIFDTEQRTSQVRILIWQGASRLVAPHDPLVKPDGSQDIFNFLRSLIGYGPETMYVAYNQYYPPELGGVEKRNASPDRSHNETWDSLVITGALGLIIYLWVFNALFYYGLKSLQLIQSKSHILLYWSFILLGTIVGTICLGIWQGWEFFGLGIPFGMVIGLMLYVGYFSLFNKQSAVNLIQNPSAIIIMVLLASVVSHFIEINFGIAIAVTRTYFWVYAAMIICLGYLFPQDNLEDGKVTFTQSSYRKHKGKSELLDSPKVNDRHSDLIVIGYTLGMILTTLGFNFITNSNRLVSSSAVISNSFTRLPNKGDISSYGILILLGTTWIVGTLLFVCEHVNNNNRVDFLWAIMITFGGSLIVAYIYYVLHAGKLVQLAKFVPKSQADLQVGLIEQSSKLGSLLTNYYVYIVLLIICVAFIIGWRSRDKSSKIDWAVAIFSLIVVWTIIQFTNLRVIQADMTFKVADPFAQNGYYDIATLLYQRALELTPHEDHYYIYLGRSYLEQAKGLGSEVEQDKLIQKASEDLKTAQRINPLNTDHTVNLGRLYSWWASRASTQEERIRRAKISSDYYAIGTKLSPNNPTLWGEWAVLYLNIFGDQENAIERLNHAISLDDSFNYTQGLMGEYYKYISHNDSDTGAKLIAMQRAIYYYEKAVELSVGRDAGTKYNYLISLGNAYLELASINPDSIDLESIQKAADAFMLSLQSGVKTADIWRIEETLARLFIQMGDFDLALDHAAKALELCPDNQKERIQALIDQFQSMP